MPLKIQCEPLLRLLQEDDLAVATEAHFAQLAPHKDKIPLAVAWDKYIELEVAGNYKVFTARRHKDLVGYISFYLFKPLRHQTVTYAKDDTVWVFPEEGRLRGLIWRALWQHAIGNLPRPCFLMGSVSLSQSDRAQAAALDILAGLGLSPVEMVMGSYLEG